MSEKVHANASAFLFASVSHPLSSRSVGIEDMLAFFLNNSRLIRHHCLLCRLRFCSFSLILSTYAARSSPKTWIHLSRSTSKRSVPSALFFCISAFLHRSFNQGCVPFRLTMSFRGICLISNSTALPKNMKESPRQYLHVQQTNQTQSARARSLTTQLSASPKQFS